MNLKEFHERRRKTTDYGILAEGIPEGVEIPDNLFRTIKRVLKNYSVNLWYTHPYGDYQKSYNRGNVTVYAHNHHTISITWHTECLRAVLVYDDDIAQRQLYLTKFYDTRKQELHELDNVHVTGGPNR